MSARTVPSGSMAEVYCRTKGKVTFVKVFAGNLWVNKAMYQHDHFRSMRPLTYLTSVRDPPPKLMMQCPVKTVTKSKS